MATAELVLESAIDALTRRTLVVASLLGKLKADTLQAPGFGSQFLRQRLVAAGVGVNQRDVAECSEIPSFSTQTLVGSGSLPAG